MHSVGRHSFENYLKHVTSGALEVFFLGGGVRFSAISQLCCSPMPIKSSIVLSKYYSFSVVKRHTMCKAMILIETGQNVAGHPAPDTQLKRIINEAREKEHDPATLIPKCSYGPGSVNMCKAVIGNEEHRVSYEVRSPYPG